MRERGYGWKQAQASSLRIHRAGSEEQTKMHKNIYPHQQIFFMCFVFFLKKSKPSVASPRGHGHHLSSASGGHTATGDVSAGDGGRIKKRREVTKSSQLFFCFCCC